MCEDSCIIKQTTVSFGKQMRTPRLRQNPLLSPLNDLLGTESNVRLLRVLSLAAAPLSATELAKRAELGRTGVYPALAALEHAGIVEFTGAGSQRHVQFRRQHPLARALRELFVAEAGRFDSLVDALRGLFAGMSARPVAAWMDRPSEGGEGDLTIELHLVGAPDALGPMTDELHERMGAVERKHGVQVAVHGLTRSEIPHLAKGREDGLSDVVLLDGVPPTTLVGAAKRGKVVSPARSHARQDQQARRLALAVATKLRWDPGLLTDMERHVERRMKKASAGERRELQEWSRLLSTMSVARLRRFLVEDGERATRLRQTLPALQVLTDAERAAVDACTTDDEVVKLVRAR